jgi:hypothetical protein
LSKEAILKHGDESKSVHWELLRSPPRSKIHSLYLEAAADSDVRMRSSTLLKYRTETILANAMTWLPHSSLNLCITFAGKNHFLTASEKLFLSF